MKKRIFSLALVAILSSVMMLACASKDEEGAAAPDAEKTEEAVPSVPKANPKPVKVVLNEVAHSIFYAPMYVAIEEGYFAEEGIDLDVVTGFGVHLLVQDKL